MTERDLSDAELDAMLGRAARYSDDDVAALSLSSAHTDLVEDIMRTPALVLPTPIATAPLRPARRRLRLVAAAAALTGAIAVGISALPSGGGNSAFAAEAVQVAKANQRVLVGAPGWRVSQVEEFTVGQGQMVFTDGTKKIELDWSPAKLHDEVVSSRSQDGLQVDHVTVLGADALFFSRGSYFSTILPAHGATFIEVKAGGPGVARTPYLDVLGSLRAVDVDTWLAALPASAVRPDATTRTVGQMLRGLPLPAVFDESRIDTGNGVRDRYQLGVAVAGTVACGWVQQWAQARDTGDAQAATAAIQALETAHNWTVLQEMTAHGDYPASVYKAAPALRGASANPSGAAEQSSAIRAELGCARLGF